MTSRLSKYNSARSTNQRRIYSLLSLKSDRLYYTFVGFRLYNLLDGNLFLTFRGSQSFFREMLVKNFRIVSDWLVIRHRERPLSKSLRKQKQFVVETFINFKMHRNLVIFSDRDASTRIKIFFPCFVYAFSVLNVLLREAGFSTNCNATLTRASIALQLVTQIFLIRQMSFRGSVSPAQFCPHLVCQWR